MLKNTTARPTTNGAVLQADKLSLSEEDRGHLAALEKKLQLVRDRTASIAQGYSTGFYLHGEGGVGKSYTVLDELKRMKANYKIFNSRLTGRGLYNALEKFPDAVHVLEDMEQIMRDKGAQGVLRSALWSQRREGHNGPQERLVTWTTFRMEHSFIFTGGNFVISNRPLAELPELNAFRTRIAVMHLQASDPELRALMREVSMRGYEHEGARLEVKECRELCEYIIEQSLSLHRSLDMRLLVNSYQDYIQWQECDSSCHWKDLVRTRLRERATAFHEEVVIEGRTARKEREREIARDIRSRTTDRAERLRLWNELTGKSEPAFYRRLSELGDG